MKHDRQRLLKVVNALTPALSGHAIIPELRHIWFTADYARAYDGALGIEVPFKLGVQCGVLGDMLADLLKSSDAETVTFAYNDDKITMKLGSSQIRLSTMPEGMIWQFKREKPKTKVGLTAELIDALTVALQVQPKKGSRVELQGVVTVADEKMCALYATDLVSMIIAPISNKHGLPHHVVLPWLFCKELVASDWEGGSLLFTDDQIMAQCADRTICSNVLDTTRLQDMRRLADTHLNGMPAPMRLPDKLAAALERAEIMDGRNKSYVVLEIEGKYLYVAGDFDSGTLDETFSLESSKHPEIKASFKSAFLIRALEEAETFSIMKGAVAFKASKPPFTWLMAEGRK